MFITFEGIDGSGKSTQVNLLADFLRKRQFPVEIVRDPGATPISEAIRNILLNPKFKEMDPRTELLLYAAARSQLTAQYIRPFLAKGGIVLSDRYYDSTTAYQGFGRELDPDLIRTLNAIGAHELRPDLTFIMDMAIEQADERLINLGKSDRMEREPLAFKTRVRNAYHRIAEYEPNRCHLIPGGAGIDDNFARIRKITLEKLQEKYGTSQK